MDVADEGIDLNAFGGRYGILLEHMEVWSGKGSDTFASAERAIDAADLHGYASFHYDADGIGSGIRGDCRVINERRVEKGQRQVVVEPFRGSGAVHQPEQCMVEKRMNKDFFANAKAQAWWSLRLRFQKTFLARKGTVTEYDPDELISISSACPDLAQLQTELSQPTYTKNGAGKLLIDKAPEGTRSPNRADTVMMLYAPGTGISETWAKLGQ
jgi:phage terminase large subunit